MHCISRLVACITCVHIVLLPAYTAYANPPDGDDELKTEKPAYESLLRYNETRKKRDINVMWSLGAWATANIISGAIGWPLETDERWSSFHQMNLAWGVINLSIAVAAGLKTNSEDPKSHDLRASIDRAHTAQQAYLLNLGLDVAYLTAGALMWERGATGNIPLLEGYGWSLVLQGGVLLIFDAVMYALDSSDNGYLYGLIQPAQAGAPPRLEVGYATRF